MSSCQSILNGIAMPSKLDHLIARHDRFLVRINRMLSAANRGAELPEECKFQEDELRSLDDTSHDIAIELLGEEPDEGEWLPPMRYAYKYGYAKGGDFGWLRELKAGMLRSKSFFEDFKSRESKEVHMHTGDKYEIGTAHVVVGSGASTGDIETHGDINQAPKAAIDFEELARELAQLRSELKADAAADDPSRDIDIGKIAAAQAAAKDSDASAVRSNLKAVSQWVLDVATKIGVGLATAALKDAMNGNSKPYL